MLLCRSELLYQEQQQNRNNHAAIPQSGRLPLCINPILSKRHFERRYQVGNKTVKGHPYCLPGCQRSCVACSPKAPSSPYSGSKHLQSTDPVLHTCTLPRGWATFQPRVQCQQHDGMCRPRPMACSHNPSTLLKTLCALKMSPAGCWHRADSHPPSRQTLDFFSNP